LRLALGQRTVARAMSGMQKETDYRFGMWLPCTFPLKAVSWWWWWWWGGGWRRKEHRCGWTQPLVWPQDRSCAWSEGVRRGGGGGGPGVHFAEAAGQWCGSGGSVWCCQQRPTFTLLIAERNTCGCCGLNGAELGQRLPAHFGERVQTVIRASTL
jgi:hypothetical protein